MYMKKTTMRTKKPPLGLITAAIGLGTAAVVVQQIKQTQQRKTQAAGRWHPITVNRDIADITLDGPELQPLLDLGSSIELRLTPAPREQGTELAARLLLDGISDKQAFEMLPKLRAALRNAQWLLETGEILSPDKPSSTHRTLTSLPLDFVTRHAREGGRL